MQALTAFMSKEDAGRNNPALAAARLTAEVSYASLWHHQIAGIDGDCPPDRVCLMFP